MSRNLQPFTAGDISAFARSLRQQLAGVQYPPGHLQLLNMLARAAGHRNYQSYRAQLAAQRRLDTAPPPPAPVDYVQLQRLARHFDDAGRLSRWPSKFSFQEPCLWVVWSQLPAREPFTEDQLNQHLRDRHTFGDHALLRRELCDHGLVARTPDGREYRRIERQPGPDALALIRHLSARRPV